MKTSAVEIQTTRSRVIDFLALTKPRLNALVVITTGVGYCLGSRGPFEVVPLLHALVGSALVAGGAATLNQIIERDIDETMDRTRRRPIPTGRIQPWEALIFAGVLTGLGLTELAIGANVLASVVALTTLVSYVAVYTPLKRLTPWSTLIGAVPGALPPVIGWSAARDALGPEAWVLFGIQFLWQLPHFHALSWIYREDFRKANLPLMAVTDQGGRRNARQALIFTVALLPMSLAPSLVGLTGRLYAGAAFGLGSAFLILAWRFAEHPSTLRARSLFIGSLVYLPLLWGLLVIDSVF
jgi:protoheme IX farnesyltransferase